MAFLFLIPLFSFSQTFSDSYVFVVGDMAIRKSQLPLSQDMLLAMNCANPEGILARAFKPLTDKKKKIVKEEFLPFFQLMVYSRSYNIKVPDRVLTLYKKSLAVNNCDQDKKIEKNFSFFQNFLALELFLRSRYVNLGEGRVQDVQYQAIEQSLKSLIDSMKEQIDYEVFAETSF